MGTSSYVPAAKGLAVDSLGGLYFVDTTALTLRYLSDAGTGGEALISISYVCFVIGDVLKCAGSVTTLAGQYTTSGTTNGVGTNALFTSPWALAFDTTSLQLYIIDNNNVLRGYSGGRLHLVFLLRYVIATLQGRFPRLRVESVTPQR